MEVVTCDRNRRTDFPRPMWEQSGAVRADVSFHLPGCWFPCRGSIVVTALIRKEVLGQWLLVISEPLQMQIQQYQPCCLSVSGLLGGPYLGVFQMHSGTLLGTQ